MPSMWEGLVDWSVLIVYGADALIYGALVWTGTLLFLIRLIFESCQPAQGAPLAAARTGPARHVTLLAVLAFLMGVGWLGLACRAEFQMRLKPSATVAIASGLACFVIASILTNRIRLHRSPPAAARRESQIASGESRKSRAAGPRP